MATFTREQLGQIKAYDHFLQAIAYLGDTNPEANERGRQEMIKLLEKKGVSQAEADVWLAEHPQPRIYGQFSRNHR